MIAFQSDEAAAVAGQALVVKEYPLKAIRRRHGVKAAHYPTARGGWILNNDRTSDLAVRVAVEVSFEHFFDHAVLP